MNSTVGVNVKNAFLVVARTYESIHKLLGELDGIADTEGFVPLTSYFLRFKSDAEEHGWAITSFIKVFQEKTATPQPSIEGLRIGPVYGVDFDLLPLESEIPLIYLSKFEYDKDLSLWTGLPRPNDHWRFYWSRRTENCEIQRFGDTFVSVPKTADLKRRFLGLDRVITTAIELTSLSSPHDVKGEIFGRLRSLQLPT